MSTKPRFKISAIRGALDYLQRGEPDAREVMIDLGEDRVDFTVQRLDLSPLTIGVDREPLT
jgi:hypothetical protein